MTKIKSDAQVPFYVGLIVTRIKWAHQLSEEKICPVHT